MPRPSFDEAPDDIRSEVLSWEARWGKSEGAKRARLRGYLYRPPTPTLNEIERLYAAGNPTLAQAHRKAHGKEYIDERRLRTILPTLEAWAESTSPEDDQRRAQEALQRKIDAKDQAEASRLAEAALERKAAQARQRAINSELEKIQKQRELERQAQEAEQATNEQEVVQ